jgi:aminoglycoside phosphotransferase (APT) family kinase protein
MLADARSAGAPWAAAFERALPDLMAADALVAPPDPAAMMTCHRDLNTENVLRAAGGGVVIMDWENSGPAQLERELATILSDLAADVAPSAAREAYAAYQAAGGPARLATAADFATAVAVQGHLLRFYGQRGLDPDVDTETRNRSKKRLDQMLRQPVTIGWIGRLLHDLNV